MLRALIVEDNLRYLEVFKMELQEHFPGLVIDAAGDGEKAMERIQESPPQLIFMDIRLPGINGLQLTKKIKADFPHICIAILTSYDLPEYRQAAIQSGAEHFFIKDAVDWNKVEALVKSARNGNP